MKRESAKECHRASEGIPLRYTLPHGSLRARAERTASRSTLFAGGYGETAKEASYFRSNRADAGASPWVVLPRLPRLPLSGGFSP